MKISFLLFSLLVSALCFAQDSRFSLMPEPSNLQPRDGQLIINTSFTVAIAGHKDARLQRVAERFITEIRKRTGFSPLNVDLRETQPATLLISATRPSAEFPRLEEDESYVLDITPRSASLTAPTTLGVIHGLQTFLQLVSTSRTGFAVPAVLIRDSPRFPWRGLMIDVSRHFIPIEVLKRNLDAMEVVKMNVFHWHLSDNQGFRVESKKFPKLQEMGSDGLFYTQDEVRELIAYAADRGIRVVPEFDMPGHSTAFLVGYPELASGAGPYQIERSWHTSDASMDPTRETTYKFLNTFVHEMGELFPDEYFHIGGDEVNGKEWDSNPRIQEFKRAHGISTNSALQAYFNRHLQHIVTKNKKVMIGWEEILSTDIPNNIVIQSWLGQASLASAAKQGYRGLLSFGYYLDLMSPASQHYAVDPISGPTSDLSLEQRKLVLGGEACMWTEYVSAENIDSRIWPRAAAIAERLWSPREVNDVRSMYSRLEKVNRDLDWLGLTQNSSYLLMLRRISDGEQTAALRVLADVVEPVKGYSRNDAPPVTPTSLVPLHRLIDAVRPESTTARHFSTLVDSFLDGRSEPGNENKIRTLLSSWRKNDIQLQPLFDRLFLMQELSPLSKQLSDLGLTGLEAMEYLDIGMPAPHEWVDRKFRMVKEAQSPKAQLLLVIVPSIKKLVEAAGERRSLQSHIPTPIRECGEGVCTPHQALGGVQRFSSNR